MGQSTAVGTDGVARALSRLQVDEVPRSWDTGLEGSCGGWLAAPFLAGTGAEWVSAGGAALTQAKRDLIPGNGNVKVTYRDCGGRIGKT